MKADQDTEDGTSLHIKKKDAEILELQEQIKQLKNELTILKNIFSLIPNHVYWKNKEGVYQVCNDTQAKSLGLNSGEDIVGKTDKELPWKTGVDYALKIDTQVMETGETIATEENTILPNGKAITYYSIKRPLYSPDTNKIVGLIGISVDITAQKEAQSLKLKEHEEIRKNLYKFIHDMQSPITSIMSMASTFKLPESERIALRNTARRASDLCHHLLIQYNKKAEDIGVFEEPEAVLVSATLAEVLTEKRYEYRKRSINFEDAFKEYFVFAYVEPGTFKRMISNIINNAVGAFDDTDGKVIVMLEATAEWVTITIQDNGKGMTPETIRKIMANTGFTEDKKDGHGIGYSQIHQTLQNNHGQLNIESAPGQGTKVILTFPRESAPFWSVDAINLESEDIVIVLDDEPSVTTAWQSHFTIALKDKSNIQVKYFNLGQEALDFINHLSTIDKDKLFLITDYELLNQSLNGLDVIEKSGAKRSILATSHYADKTIHAQAIKMGTKILPKQLIPEISINVITKIDQAQKVDLILVDDNELFAQAMMLTIFADLHVVHYASPTAFLKHSSQYPKDTKICLDKNFTENIDGISLANKLHEQGFSRIFLVSGEHISPDTLPEYINVVHKEDIQSIKDY